MKLFVIGIFLILHVVGYSQGMDNINKFTKYDIYKWRHEMNFKPKYISGIEAYDDFILSIDQQIYDQWYIELYNTWHDYKHGNNARYFTFKTQLIEYYGETPDDVIKKWYVPLYVFLEIDKWAKTEYLKKH